MKENNLKKNIIWNIIGTTISSFNSLFFLIIITRINGVNDAGVFSFAFSFACLLYIIGIYSGRIYQVTDSSSEYDSYSYINSHLITCIFMILLSVLFCVFRHYSIYKLLIVLLLVVFKSLEAFSETLYAIIQREDNLYKVGISLLIKAVVSIAAFLITDAFFKNLLLSIIAIVIINLLVIILYDWKNTGIKVKDYNFNSNKIKKLFSKGFYTFAFTFLNLYLINLSKYMIDFLSSDDVQAIFNILVMPATFVSMFAQFIIHPLLLKIKNYITFDDHKDVLGMASKLSIIILSFGLLSCLFGYFLGIPVLNIIYGLSLNEYKNDLIIVLLGATFYSIMTVFSNILTAYRTTLSQLISYLTISIICTIASAIIIKHFSVHGAVYSYFMAMILLFCSITFLFYKVVIKKVKRKR